jgi:hypothetical protein
MSASPSQLLGRQAAMGRSTADLPSAVSAQVFNRLQHAHVVPPATCSLALAGSLRPSSASRCCVSSC